MISSRFIRHHLTIVLFFAAALVAVAQDVVSLPSLTQGDRGLRIRIPVTGTITQSGSSRVTFSYPADVIRVLSVEGGDGFAFHCPQFQVNSNTIIGATTGQVDAQCEEVVAVTNGPLFEIVAEVMRGPGTSGPLTITELILNGATVINADLGNGTVEATGLPPVSPSVTQGFTGNYPNPFAASSTFVFQMRKASEVQLSVLNIQGRHVLELGSYSASAGENSYQFDPEGWELAQGAYVMQMVVDGEQFLHAFMVVK